MSDSYVEGDLAQLDNLVSELKTDYHVDIGILGDPPSGDSELALAEIGAVHEFGAPERNIPERSFIRMPLESRQSQISKKVSGHVQAKLAAGDVKGIFTMIGIEGENVIQEAFETGGFGQWPDLAEATIERKGSSAILIDEGFLRRGITSKVGLS